MGLHIVVVPTSSKTGAEAIRVLLADKRSPVVTGVYRNFANVPHKFGGHTNFKGVRGDVRDVLSLDFRGSDAVLAITPPIFDCTDTVKHVTLASQSIKAAIRKAGSVSRLVYVSSPGAQFSERVVWRDKTSHVAETIFHDSAPEVVLIRCAYFIENFGPAIKTTLWSEGFFYSTTTPLNYKVPIVGAGDRGRQCATKPPCTPYVDDLHSPKSYSPLDVQQAFEYFKEEGRDKTGRKEQLPAFFGQPFPPNIVDDWVEMSVSFLPGGIAAHLVNNPDNLER
ncbi:hypothetical protein GQ53DRAFT_671328 [Thozetella sp. PMI_491]|nr:hypothetical protein GQ53DRAFT_671328 [Thozetella sp. PMI_491]